MSVIERKLNLRDGRSLTRRAIAWGIIARIVVAVILCVLALAPIALANRYIFHIATMVVLMASLSVGMNMMLRLGQLSMAQAAFMGIGAYSSALLTIHAGVESGVAFVISGIGVGILALLLGPVFLRVRGVYFVLLTYAFGQVVNLIFQQWTNVFGGNSGLYGIAKIEIFDFRLVSPVAIYICGLSMLCLTVLVALMIYRSHIGEIIASLNEDEELCRSLGTDAITWRVFIFSVSAAMAGFSGSFYAHFIGFLAPSAFDFYVAVDILVLNVVGGISSLFGPLVGAAILVPLPEFLRSFSQYQTLGYGLALMAFMLFFRRGITGLIFGSRGEQRDG